MWGPTVYLGHSLLDQCLKVGREVPCVLPSREVVPIVVMGLSVNKESFLRPESFFIHLGLNPKSAL